MRGLWVVGLVAGMTGSLSAQGLPRLQLDLRAGYNYANMSVEELPGTTGRSGVLAGASFGIVVTPWIAIQPELHVSQKGSDLDAVIAELTGDPRVGGDLLLTYIEVPLVVRWGRMQGRGIRPSVFAGLAVAFRAACSARVSVGGQVFEDSCNRAGLTTANGDLSTLVGGRLELPLSRESSPGGGGLFAEVRYTYGTVNVNTIDLGRNMYHRVLTLSVGARVTS